MFKRMLKNKKGTAEVVGSVMFIVILLFFFTNVYLWHDAATKEMNQLQVQKINSPIAITYDSNTRTISVTNNGGQDALVTGLWVIEQSAPGTPDSSHKYYNLVSQYNFVVRAGGSPETISLSHYLIGITDDLVGKHGIFKVVTSTGNIASCSFNPE
jgi:hypothetical protein